MGRSQPVARYDHMIIYVSIKKKVYLYRGPASRYEDESPPPQARNAGRQQKPAGGGGHGYGEYDHLYKNAPVSV